MHRVKQWTEANRDNRNKPCRNNACKPRSPEEFKHVQLLARVPRTNMHPMIVTLCRIPHNCTLRPNGYGRNANYAM